VAVLGTGMAFGESRVSCSAVGREGLVVRVDGVVEKDIAAVAWVDGVTVSAGAGSVVEVERFIDTGWLPGHLHEVVVFCCSGTRG
jgi:hypothetical protein